MGNMSEESISDWYNSFNYTTEHVTTVVHKQSNSPVYDYVYEYNDNNDEYIDLTNTASLTTQLSCTTTQSTQYTPISSIQSYSTLTTQNDNTQPSTLFHNTLDQHKLSIYNTSEPQVYTLPSTSSPQAPIVHDITQHSGTASNKLQLNEFGAAVLQYKYNLSQSLQYNIAIQHCELQPHQLLYQLFDNIRLPQFDSIELYRRTTTRLYKLQHVLVQLLTSYQLYQYYSFDIHDYIHIQLQIHRSVVQSFDSDELCGAVTQLHKLTQLLPLLQQYCDITQLISPLFHKLQHILLCIDSVPVVQLIDNQYIHQYITLQLIIHSYVLKWIEAHYINDIHHIRIYFHHLCYHLLLIQCVYNELCNNNIVLQSLWQQLVSTISMIESDSSFMHTLSLCATKLIQHNISPPVNESYNNMACNSTIDINRYTLFSQIQRTIHKHSIDQLDQSVHAILYRCNIAMVLLTNIVSSQCCTSSTVYQPLWQCIDTIIAVVMESDSSSIINYVPHIQQLSKHTTRQYLTSIVNILWRHTTTCIFSTDISTIVTVAIPNLFYCHSSTIWVIELYQQYIMSHTSLQRIQYNDIELLRDTFSDACTVIQPLIQHINTLLSTRHDSTQLQQEHIHRICIMLISVVSITPINWWHQCHIYDIITTLYNPDTAAPAELMLTYQLCVQCCYMAIKRKCCLPGKITHSMNTILNILYRWSLYDFNDESTMKLSQQCVCMLTRSFQLLNTLARYGIDTIINLHTVIPSTVCIQLLDNKHTDQKLLHSVISMLYTFMPSNKYTHCNDIPCTMIDTIDNSQLHDEQLAAMDIDHITHHAQQQQYDQLYVQPLLLLYTTVQPHISAQSMYDIINRTIIQCRYSELNELDQNMYNELIHIHACLLHMTAQWHHINPSTSIQLYDACSMYYSTNVDYTVQQQYYIQTIPLRYYTSLLSNAIYQCSQSIADLCINDILIAVLYNICTIVSETSNTVLLCINIIKYSKCHVLVNIFDCIDMTHLHDAPMLRQHSNDVLIVLLHSISTVLSCDHTTSIINKTVDLLINKIQSGQSHRSVIDSITTITNTLNINTSITLHCIECITHIVLQNNHRSQLIQLLFQLIDTQRQYRTSPAIQQHIHHIIQHYIDCISHTTDRNEQIDMIQPLCSTLQQYHDLTHYIVYTTLLSHILHTIKHKTYQHINGVLLIILQLTSIHTITQCTELITYLITLLTMAENCHTESRSITDTKHIQWYTVNCVYTKMTIYDIFNNIITVNHTDSTIINIIKCMQGITCMDIIQLTATCNPAIDTIKSTYILYSFSYKFVLAEQQLIKQWMINTTQPTDGALYKHVRDQLCTVRENHISTNSTTNIITSASQLQSITALYLRLLHTIQSYQSISLTYFIEQTQLDPTFKSHHVRYKQVYTVFYDQLPKHCGACVAHGYNSNVLTLSDVQTSWTNAITQVAQKFNIIQ